MEIIIYLVVLVIGIFILRALGAWMLRIDEVIELLKEIKKQGEQKDQK